MGLWYQFMLDPVFEINLKHLGPLPILEKTCNSHSFSQKRISLNAFNE